jgi:glucose/arabinose dehydrogenase
MNRTPVRAAACALASAALVIALAGCAAESEAAPTTSPSPSAAEPSSTPTPEPSPTESAEEPAVDPTCETLIAPSTIEIFEEHGWTYEEREFRIGADVVDGGLECVWGDYSIASDHVQIFGWAPLGAAESAAAQEKLVGEGWLRADEDGRTYITEDPEFAIAVDEAGFGMTYEFGDGWVTLADTKQSLVLIQRP